MLLGGSHVNDQGRDSPLLVSLDAANNGLKWALKMNYVSGLVDSDNLMLDEYFTVDSIVRQHSIDNAYGFSGCYDQNAYSKQGCSKFIMFKIWTASDTLPTDVERVVPVMFSIEFSPNVFRKYYAWYDQDYFG